MSIVISRACTRSSTLTPRVGAQAGVQLAVADVHRVDVRRAPLEQTIGEAAGRRAGVDGAAALDDDGEAFECRLELLPAAADERRRRADQRDGLVGRNEAGRLVGRCTGDEDGPRFDGVARVLA